MPLRRGPFLRPLTFATLAAFVSLACLTPGSAYAQPASNADALIEHGIQLREHGHDDQALVEFRRAYAMSPSPRARAQMGLAEQALGQWVLAEAHLQEALAASGDAWVSGRRAILTNATSVIAHHLGSLIVAGTSRGGARVLLDGVDVGAFPLMSPVRVETGSRLLEVRAAGFYPVIRTIEIAAGATARENVNLVPSSLPEGSTAPAAPAEKVYVNEGVRVPGAFHASFLPGGPAIGVWTLRDAQDALMCTLPCTYWIDPKQKYTLNRATMVVGGKPDVRLDVPPLLFAEGAEVREQVKGPTGSFYGGIALIAGGAAVLVGSVVLYATAPSSTTTDGVTVPSTSSYYQDYFGVIGMIAGGLGAAAGVAFVVLSEPWRVDARATTNAPAASLKLTKKGVELAAESVHGWLTPNGIQGTF